MSEKVILTNMCMVYDGNGNILVQDRVDRRWPGVTFPGGHIEPGESFTLSVIREVKEETGLTVSSPVLCGIKQWPIDKNERYIVLFYKTNKFSGELRSSSEGRVFWIKEAELLNYKLADDFEDMYRIFKNDSLQEFFWTQENGEWVKYIY